MAATNRDLERDVKSGQFREDLFYRLSVFRMRVPPLRERLEDVPLLAAHFVERAQKRLNLKPVRLPRTEVARLTDYEWPGNVRELQNVVERAAILSRGGALRFEELRVSSPPSAGEHSKPSSCGRGPRTEVELKRAAREATLAALQESGGRIYGPGGAAERLGVKPTTFASRLRALGLRRKTPR